MPIRSPISAWGTPGAPNGDLWLTSPLDATQKELFKALKIKTPPKVWDYKARQKLPETV
ncbi:MAG: hypothetical protein SAMD01599839_17600 [Rectinema sp.]